MTKEEVTAKNYTEEYFDHELQARRGSKEWARARIVNVLSFLKPSEQDVIADIGCGTGTFSVECARKENSVYAVDFSCLALKTAIKVSNQARIGNRIYFVKSSADAIAIKNDSMYKVVCADLIEYLTLNSLRVCWMNYFE